MKLLNCNDSKVFDSGTNSLKICRVKLRNNGYSWDNRKSGRVLEVFVFHMFDNQCLFVVRTCHYSDVLLYSILIFFLRYTNPLKKRFIHETLGCIIYYITF